MKSYDVVRNCPKCGPRTVRSPNEKDRHPETIVCPTCGMDPAEYAYTERILTLGSDEVYRQEVRAFEAARRQAVA